MTTKIEAARIATAAGVVTTVAAAERVEQVLTGEDVGTVFLPVGVRGRSRRLWLQHATTARGRLIIDDGAVTALVERKKSLLPAGITAVEGTFHDGDPVDVCSPDGTAVARGLVNYSSSELPALLGRSTKELARDLGPEYEREVIHRDDLVVI
jgi:glutamate 5-kinase